MRRFYKSLVEWSPGRVGEELDWRYVAGLLDKTGRIFKGVILNEGQFCPLGDIWQYLEMLLAVTAGCWGDTGYLVGRSPGCRYTSYNAQDRPHRKELCGSNVNSVECKKPQFIVKLVSVMSFSSFSAPTQIFIKFIN